VPQGEKEPTKKWLSNFPKEIAFCQLVDIAVSAEWHTHGGAQ
jgi:hypothetical protein